MIVAGIKQGYPVSLEAPVSTKPKAFKAVWAKKFLFFQLAHALAKSAL